MKLWLAKRLFSLLGDTTQGTPDAPCYWLDKRFSGDEIEAPLVLKTGNGAAEFWLGTPDRWQFHAKRKTAHKIAWFILWDWWIKGEWFGLRRVLWFWALRRIVASYNREKVVK